MFKTLDELQAHIVAMDGWNDHTTDDQLPKKSKRRMSKEEGKNPLMDLRCVAASNSSAERRQGASETRAIAIAALKRAIVNRDRGR